MAINPTDRQRATPERQRRRIRFADMTWKDYLRISLGVVMFVLGILGLVLPFLQGILFLIVSAMLLAPYSLWVQKKLAQLEARFPWLFDKARAITRRWRKDTPDAGG